MFNETVKPVETKVIGAEQLNELLLKMERLEKEQTELKSQVASAPISKPKTVAEIDWSKITEADVFDLDMPIPVFEQEMPDFLDLHLADQNFVPRWVHKMAENLGPNLNNGFTFITEEDLDPNFPAALPFSANGHLEFKDVVALKCHKMKYFGALRRIQVKSQAVQGVSGMNRVKGKIRNAMMQDSRLEEAHQKGQMTFFDDSAVSETEVHL